jgi:hypothetical protein
MSDLFAPAPEPPTELGRYRILSSTAGVRVSPLCLGAMSIGDAWAGVSPPDLAFWKRLKSTSAETNLGLIFFSIWTNADQLLCV